MDKYLLLLLKEVKTVIIPELGALTVIDPDKGEFMFMPYLKHDDGKLAEFIASKENIDLNEAKILVAKYAREILAAIDKGEDYTIYQFGSFTKEGGDIQFNTWTQDQEEAPAPAIEREVELPSNEARESDEAKINEFQTEEPVIEASAKEISETLSSDDIRSQPEIPVVEDPAELKQRAIEESVLDPVRTEKAPAPSEPLKSKDVIIPQKNQTIIEKEAIEKGREKMRQLKEQQETKKTKKKRKPSFWILILLVVILGVGAVLLGVNYQEWKQHIPFLADKVEHKDHNDRKKEMEEMLGVDPEPSTESELEEDAKPETEEPIIEESEPEKPSVSVENSINTSGNFHAIAGAFSSKENADRMANKLKDQGYPAFVIQRGALYFVSMKQFSSKEEANAAVPSLKASAAQVWIFEGELK